MIQPRWKLSDLMVLIIVCGLAFAAYHLFWEPPPGPNPRGELSAFLACLAIASLGSFFARPTWRRAFQGFAAFGWCELAFVVWRGFAQQTISDVLWISEGSRMGVVLGILCAILAVWLLEPVRAPSAAVRSAPEPDSAGGSVTEGQT
jgi:hypothetical protein